MATTKVTRPSQGSSTFDSIDGISFPGLGSGGFGPNDFLIVGDDADNFDLIGEIGHDEIEGEAGNDRLLGGDGNDTLEGDAGDDDLDGQAGTDILRGGDGNDILRAGDGHDLMTGGAGSDTFGFYGVGIYHVNDFTIGEDRFFFDAEKIGVDNVVDLVGAITDVATTVNGVNVIFGGGIASIELVGMTNLDSITAEMVVFSLG